MILQFLEESLSKGFLFFLGGREKKVQKAGCLIHGHMTRCELRASNSIEQTQKLEDVSY